MRVRPLGLSFLPGRWHRVVAAAIAFGVALAPTGTVRPATLASRPPVVIAIVEPGGFNVLHSDFRLSPTQRLTLPRGVPDRMKVRLPLGSWGRQLHKVERGPLGRLRPRVLYSVGGTRILGIWGTKDATVSNIMSERSHGTGTASSAVGLAHGTNPDAWLVFVPDVSEAAWRWVARQRWIDVVSTSYVNLLAGQCASVQAISQIVQDGRLVFSGVGNGEQFGSVFDPSGVADAYQVGGVDDEGRPYLPPA